MRLHLILPLAFIVALVAASASSAASFTHCGRANVNGYPDNPLQVRALGVTCATAKGIARKHYRSCRDAPTCTVAFFACRQTPFGDAGTRVRCVGDNAIVKFVYGV